MGGMANWITIFPIDVIKSRVQTSEASQYKGMLDCYRCASKPDGGVRVMSHRFDSVSLAVCSKVVKTEGYRALYRGLTPCLVRAFPGAIVFACHSCLAELTDALFHVANAACFACFELAMRGLNSVFP
jgi:hypothetical protein